MVSITSEQDFEYWLFEMDDILERFLAILPRSVRSELDFSTSSLDTLEKWILDMYPDISEIQKPSEAFVLDGLARYVGETFRKELGGYWRIQFDNPKYAHHGLPELTGFSTRSTPICPQLLITASVDRRIGTYLSTVLNNSKKLSHK
jgi:hypothetical protein